MGLAHTLALQLRRPSGWLGRLAGLFFRFNREGIDWTIDLLDIRPTDRILEIGFGSGYGIQQAAAHATQGKVTGVDFSDAMMAQARRRNAAAIAAGRVDLHQGDAGKLPFPDYTFDKIFATNVIYFWPDPVATAKELRRVLKPGGRLALYVIAKEDLAGIKIVQTGVYTLYNDEELVRVLQHAGFPRARTETKSERFRTGLCGLAEK